MSEYSFPIEITDTSVAFDCEADRAEREGFKHVAERQRAKALHLRNAYEHMRKFCLLSELNWIDSRRGVYKLRVTADGDTVKFKVNESTWTPPMGHLDPQCSKALRDRGVQ